MKPIGFVDEANENFVRGWSFDGDADMKPVYVHIYVDRKRAGYARADLFRPDLTGHVGSPNHGFKFIFPKLSAGEHIVHVYGINIPYGPNPQLTRSPKTITIGGGPVDVPGSNPKLFTFFKEQKFLKMVSFFDVVGSNQSGNMQDDLDWLVDSGIDGVRLMVNWGAYRKEACMYDAQGNFDTGLNSKFAHFNNVVYQAGLHGLVADVSIISLPTGVSQNAFRIGNINLIRELLKWNYDHLIIDLSNEHYQINNGVTLAQDMRNLGGDKWYYGISIAGGRTPEDAWKIVGPEGCSVFRYHDPRNVGSADATVDLARRALKCNDLVYFDEPFRNGWGGLTYPASDFIRACTHARNVGIAGWCYHNDKCFNLTETSFRNQLSSVEKQAIAGIGKV